MEEHLDKFGDRMSPVEMLTTRVQLLLTDSIDESKFADTMELIESFLVENTCDCTGPIDGIPRSKHYFDTDRNL
jgi:hypothetical protein